VNNRRNKTLTNNCKRTKEEEIFTIGLNPFIFPDKGCNLQG
jgi:hypothetical protein